MSEYVIFLLQWPPIRCAETVQTTWHLRRTRQKGTFPSWIHKKSEEDRSSLKSLVFPLSFPFFLNCCMGFEGYADTSRGFFPFSLFFTLRACFITFLISCVPQTHTLLPFTFVLLCLNSKLVTQCQRQHTSPHDSSFCFHPRPSETK